MNRVSPADMIELKKQYQGKDLDIVLNRINSGYPVQYEIGYVNFCGNRINVTQDVLIPRYETEFLVDLIKNKVDKSFSGNIIDIGTGSGCISISLAKIFEQSIVKGIDISKNAIKIANTNQKINKVTNVTFVEKDIFQLKNLNGYDMIVSNPPYVSRSESVGEETKYEPRNAIFADDNGLEFYKHIIKLIRCSDIKPSYIFFEIGMNQAKDIINESEKEIPEYNHEVYKDLANKDRYIYLYLNK